MRVALLSPGAMGSAIGARLAQHGATVVTSLAGRSEATAERARAVGMTDVADGDLIHVDLILSILPPAEAEPLVRRLLPLLADARSKPLFIDANALAPASKQAMAGLLEGVGVPFLDACIIGAPPVEGNKGPTIHVAGPDADRALPLARLGLDVRVLDGPIGAAAALKMCFSGINKGLVGLATAMLRAADRAGAGEALRGELAERLPDLGRRLTTQVPDMYPKAYRWVAEMEEIAAFLGEDPDGAAIYHGMARLYALMARDAGGDGRERAALDRALGR